LAPLRMTSQRPTMRGESPMSISRLKLGAALLAEVITVVLNGLDH
jgi:hypothetical protein